MKKNKCTEGHSKYVTCWKCPKEVNYFINTKKHKTCLCDSCRSVWYNEPCHGCGFHPSFWKTVISSPQWSKWVKYAEPKMIYDFSEVEEMGCISPEHFQDFIKFIKK